MLWLWLLTGIADFALMKVNFHDKADNERREQAAHRLLHQAGRYV